MVKLSFNPRFQSIFYSIKDKLLKEKIIKQVEKIKANPEVGKPMRYNRKRTRELYVKPFRLSYAYIKENDEVVVLDLYHKDEQ